MATFESVERVRGRWQAILQTDSGPLGVYTQYVESEHEPVELVAWGEGPYAVVRLAGQQHEEALPILMHYRRR